MCPKCGKQIPNNAAFCMFCGFMMHPADPNSGLTPGSSKSRGVLLGAFAAFVLIALALVGLGAAGVLQFRREPAKHETLSQTSRPADEPTLRVQRDVPEQTIMPPEIRAWLEHLRETEERRAKLSNAHLSSAMVALTRLKGGDLSANLGNLLEEDATGPATTPPSVEFSSEAISSMRGEWRDLTSFFNSKQPPPECQSIRNDYDQALRETGATIVDLLEILGGSSSDPQAALTKLYGMQGQSKGKIDAAAERADEGVQDICDKYETKKWFEIRGDIGGGGSLGGLF